MERERVVLEPSTNTHVLEAESVQVTELGNGIKKLVIKGEGNVLHGEHGTMRTETEHVMKYIQQEVNPISKKMENAWD